MSPDDSHSDRSAFGTQSQKLKALARIMEIPGDCCELANSGTTATSRNRPLPGSSTRTIPRFLLAGSQIQIEQRFGDDWPAVVEKCAGGKSELPRAEQARVGGGADAKPAGGLLRGENEGFGGEQSCGFCGHEQSDGDGGGESW